MSDYRIVPTTHEHICELCANAREADVREFAALGETVESALSDGLRLSSFVWTGLADGEVLCIFGVASQSMLSGDGVPWMVGSKLLDKHAWGFLPRSRMVVGHMLNIYPHLENYVDARNTRAIRWLRWLGFTIHDPEPYGLQGELFHRFEMGGVLCATQSR